MSKAINDVREIEYISDIQYIKPGIIVKDRNDVVLSTPVPYGYSLKILTTFPIEYTDEFTGEQEIKEITKMTRIKSSSPDDNEKNKNIFLECRKILKLLKSKKQSFQIPIKSLDYKQADCALNMSEFIERFKSTAGTGKIKEAPKN